MSDSTQTAAAPTLPRRLPVFILGGRDREGNALPASAHNRQRLLGFKGADLRVGGRPLIAVLIDRLRDSGAFGPVYVAGPLGIYRDVVDDATRIVDTDGSFADNLRACLQAFAELRAEEARAAGVPLDGEAMRDRDQMVVTTCDILPDPVELREALDGLERDQPVHFWMPQVRIPDDKARLGTSDWKPRYRLRRQPDSAPVPILPGHILLARPPRIRLEFVLELFDRLYATRNRSVIRRIQILAGGMLWSLAKADLGNLLRGKAPKLLVPITWHMVTLALKLRKGEASAPEMEDRLARVFLRRAEHRRHPTRRGSVPILDALSIGRDIDTVEEARELADLPADDGATTP